MEGVDAAKLQALLQAQQEQSKKQKVVPGQNGDHEPLALNGAASGVLNATKASSLGFVIGTEAEGEALKSDCDEQLLVTLTLQQASKIHSVKFSAPEASSAPKTIKLFINRSNLSFDDVEDMAPTQMVTMSGTSATIPLQFVKFQNVSSLAVFIQDNQGDEESTSLSRIELIGTPLSTTNMSDLKKGG